MKEYKTEINGSEMMIDAQGRYVPCDTIRAVDLLRDELIRSLIPEVEEISKKLAELKAKAFKDVDDFLALSASQYGVRARRSRATSLSRPSMASMRCVWLQPTTSSSTSSCRWPRSSSTNA